MDLKKQAADYLKSANSAKIMYILAVALMALFFITRIDLIAVVAAVLFIFGVFSESADSVKEKGLAHELKEIAIAIGLALFLWFGASFVLNTSSPFNAVVSCSMLNTLHRGDVIILQGGALSVPEVNVSEEEMSLALESGEAHYVCGFCRDNSTLTPCPINPSTGLMAEGNLIRYKCGMCAQEQGSVIKYIACTEGVYVGGKYFDATLKQGDIVVYRPQPDDLFAATGDIIHRGIVKINAGNSTYVLTKGDNNPVFDAQFVDTTSGRTNSLVQPERVVGRTLLSLPFLGYVKLVASGQLANPENCEMLVKYSSEKQDT